MTWTAIGSLRDERWRRCAGAPRTSCRRRGAGRGRPSCRASSARTWPALAVGELGVVVRCCSPRARSTPGCGSPALARGRVARSTSTAAGARRVVARLQPLQAAGRRPTIEPLDRAWWRSVAVRAGPAASTGAARADGRGAGGCPSGGRGLDGLRPARPDGARCPPASPGQRRRPLRGGPHRGGRARPWAPSSPTATIPAEAGRGSSTRRCQLHQGLLHRPGAGGPHRQPGRQRAPPPAGRGRSAASVLPPAAPRRSGRSTAPTRWGVVDLRQPASALASGAAGGPRRGRRDRVGRGARLGAVAAGRSRPEASSPLHAAVAARSRDSAEPSRADPVRGCRPAGRWQVAACRTPSAGPAPPGPRQARAGRQGDRQRRAAGGTGADTPTSPPMASTSSRTMARPEPGAGLLAHAAGAVAT